MFNAYIVLDEEESNEKKRYYCLSTFSAEGQKNDSTAVGMEAKDPTSPNLTLHLVKDGNVTAKQLFSFVDGQIISMFTGFPISVNNSPTDQTKKWKLMADGQIRTMDNYCITVIQKGQFREVTLQKYYSKSNETNEKIFQKWKIVTKFPREDE